MALSSLSLAVVGADYPNRKGPGRRFEIELCRPGEPVVLIPEPKNPADPRAVAVFSCRGIQIGYLSAERCGWIGSIIGSGRDVRAIFQHKTSYGAAIRVAFDGEEPALPPVRHATEQPVDDSGFYPDEEWPD
ncbi:MAG: HIRAN domain-containing protein [Allosphingosinicella sp.]|uniref:HIRAN domain-containing protein n=1 Tax=Allosphingosinicella sp. TaxID=2823234 RepID=UPI00396102B8